MKQHRIHTVLCNGATRPKTLKNPKRRNFINLDYTLERDARVRIRLPDFVRQVYHLPERCLDLLEIAAYVYCADRLVSRGDRTRVEPHSWSRHFHFVIKVRDHSFWKQTTVRKALSEALEFMTGDRKYEFDFQKGRSTPPADLFDREEFHLPEREETSVLLFSGGLDSLTGAVDRLKSGVEHVCLVSHQSHYPGTKLTQNTLVRALRRDYGNRVDHYSFECSLRGQRAIEETQRTRVFLYTAIAFALAHVLKKDGCYIYENGVTSINLRRREDLLNARASRTTHPRTLILLQEFYSLVNDSRFLLTNPFIWKTKADVLSLLDRHGEDGLLSTAVSCSKTFRTLGSATHCGECFQCIDRRFACYATALHDIDDRGLYARDVINESVDESSTKTTLIDYVRQACEFRDWSIDHFAAICASELVDLGYGKEDSSELEITTKVYELIKRHSTQVLSGLHAMRQVHDDLTRELPEGSLLRLVSDRDHLKSGPELLASSIADRVGTAIPTMFQRCKCQSEADLNDKVQAILSDSQRKFEREYPAMRFALSTAVPDHSTDEADLIIESKFIRDGTSPSKVSEGIAADIVKYSSSYYLLFLVYDPHRRITDDHRFSLDFERKRPCHVRIFR